MRLGLYLNNEFQADLAALADIERPFNHQMAARNPTAQTFSGVEGS